MPEENATQWTQGPGPLANHDAHNANAVLSFVPINNSNEALRLLPRVPTLRAHRRISKGEEITFNYGSSLPFASVQQREEVTEIPPVLSCEVRMKAPLIILLTSSIALSLTLTITINLTKPLP